MNPKKVALKRRTWQGSALAGRHPHYQEDIFSFNFIFIFNVCFFPLHLQLIRNSSSVCSSLLRLCRSFCCLSRSLRPSHASPLALFPSGLALSLLLNFPAPPHSTLQITPTKAIHHSSTDPSPPPEPAQPSRPALHHPLENTINFFHRDLFSIPLLLASIRIPGTALHTSQVPCSTLGA